MTPLSTNVCFWPQADIYHGFQTSSFSLYDAPFFTSEGGDETTRVHHVLGGAAVALPLAARAQQGERVRRIGVLTGLSEDDPQGQALVGAFLQGLQQLGWIDGRNAMIDKRWGGGHADDMRKYQRN